MSSNPATPAVPATITTPGPGQLSLLEGQILDMVAAGKTPRQISEAVGVSPSEASRLAYDLLDKEIVTDTTQRRNLQVYRLERLLDALWQRTLDRADRDDVENVMKVIGELNTLLGLYKEADEELFTKMYEHQLAVYYGSLSALIAAFREIAPEALPTEDAWAAWGAEQLMKVQKEFTGEEA